LCIVVGNLNPHCMNALYYISAMTFSVATSIDKIRISLLVDRGATTNSSDIDNLTSLIYNEFEKIFQFANQLVRKND